MSSETALRLLVYIYGVQIYKLGYFIGIYVYSFQYVGGLEYGRPT